jgi:hypothetical protein
MGNFTVIRVGLPAPHGTRYHRTIRDPEGSRNKLGEDFAKHGPAVIEKVRTDKPDAYLKIVASLLLKDINLNVRPLDELSDDQLLARLAQLTEMAKPLLAKRDQAISTAGLTRQ